MCKNKRYYIPLLLFMLIPLLSIGQIDIGKPKEVADPTISKDEAVYEFVSNRPDLMIESSSSSIDSVYPEIYPEGDLTRYKVRLKLTNGVDRLTTRNFRLTVKESTVTGEHPNKRLKGGTRYEVEAMVPDVVIDQKDRSRTTDFYPMEKKAQVVLRSKYQLDISWVGSTKRFNPERTPDGFNQYKVAVAVDSLNADGLVEPQLLVTVKGQKSNNIYIDLSELKSRDKKTYEIYKVDLPAINEQRGNVVFVIKPADVETWITFAGKKGIPAKDNYQGGFVRYGAYPYEVKASNDYHVEQGIVVVKSSRVDVPINLRTRYGTLIVQGAKAVGATIYLDGEKMGTAPKTIEKVISGKHTLRVTKERCEPYEEEIYIEDGQTIRRSPELNIRYEHLAFTVGEDAEIWINGKLSGMGKAEGDYEGEVIVECKKEHYTSTRQKFQANPGAERTIQLEQPKPKVGNVNISSNPGDAQVFIDRILQKERTPILVSGLIEGKHELLIRKKGQADEYRDVEIKEGETVQISVSFQKSHSIKVRPNVQDYAVSVNGRELGKVKSLELAPGDHHVKVVAHGYEDFTKTVSVPGLSELRVTMQKKQYNVTVKCDDRGAKVQRDGLEYRFNVNIPLKLDYGQHSLTVMNGEISTELKVYIDKDTIIEVNFANMQNGTESQLTATQENDSKAKTGKTREKTPEKTGTESKVESTSEPKVVIREERSNMPEQRVEENAAVAEEYEDDEGYDAEEEESQFEEIEESVVEEPFDKRFKYKDFSRWTLDLNAATTLNDQVLYGGTLAITGKGGWGFYITGYYGKNKYGETVAARYSDVLRPDIIIPLGAVRRIGSYKKVRDIQVYLGVGPSFHDKYTYYDFINENGDYSRYARTTDRAVEYCVDFGMRFGLDYRTKFGWINFTLGGLYVKEPGSSGDERFFFTGGISLGNALVAGTLAGFLIGLPEMLR